MKNYIRYHVHSYCSLLDSTTSYKSYVDEVVKEGGKAIAFTEHGNIYNWVDKKLYCDEKGIKYIHGMEAYLTQGSQFNKRRDNYHIVLLAKNLDGVHEINELFSKSYQSDHFYFKPRITFEEFLNISENVITTSACLGGPLWQIQNEIEKIEGDIDKLNSTLSAYSVEYNKIVLSKQTSKTQEKLAKLQNLIDEDSEKVTLLNENKEYLKNMYIPLLKKFDYLEIQPHIPDEQKNYNKMLFKYAKKYNKKLIAGTDTHSLNEYEAACRNLLIKDKKKNGKVEIIACENDFDLTWKTYEKLIEAFKEQNALPEAVYLKAIDNTNELYDLVEDFELDKSFKYPDIPGVTDEKLALQQRINERFVAKRDAGIIDLKLTKKYLARIREEFRVFEKIGMLGFMLFMSNLMTWVKEQGIPVSPCRGSVGGCLIAYIIDIIDVDPIIRNTIFSRFANEDRIEIGDIDVDIPPDQRDLVYEFIMDSYPYKQTSYILSFGTQKALGTIDSLGRAYNLPTDEVKNIKSIFKTNYEKLIAKFPEFFKESKEQLGFGTEAEIEYIKKRAEKKHISEQELRNIVSYHKQNTAYVREKYPDIAKYYNGLFGVPVSQSMHPAGIIVSPSSVNLPVDYGVFISDGKKILPIDMEECHEISLVKYDILGLKQMQILRITCESAGLNPPLAHEIDWNDEIVWKHMLDSPIGLFQFEGKYAFDLLSKFGPRSVDDMTLVNASLRPSGASYRDDLIAGKINKNPSKQIDDLLAKNRGYLIYQEDTIKFLQDICGLSGSEADNVRRAIGRKQQDRLERAMPEILNGYCKKSDKPREVAEQEANAFLQIIKDSASYQFGYNHATGYSMVGYECIYFRTYFPAEFIVGYLNSAKDIDDVVKGDTLANSLDISYLNEPTVRQRKAEIISKLSSRNISADDLPKYPKKVRIYKPTFGKSKGRYTFNIDDYSIYKGVGSIKALNSNSADELYELAQKDCYTGVERLSAAEKRYKFYELIKDCLTNTSLKKNQLEILIKLDFFSMFGKNKTLMRIYDTVNSLTKFKFDNVNHKSFKKVEIPFYDINVEQLMAFVGKETPKMYSDINLDKYFKAVFEKYDDEAIPLKEQLEYEQDNAGTYLTRINTKKPCYYVENIRVYQYKNKPYLDLFNLKTGQYEKYSVIDAKYYINNSLEISDIITDCAFDKVQKKTKLEDGTVIKTDQYKDIIIKWKKI